jgi:hypothetical protein
VASCSRAIADTLPGEVVLLEIYFFQQDMYSPGGSCHEGKRSDGHDLGPDPLDALEVCISVDLADRDDSRLSNGLFQPRSFASQNP